MRVLISGWFVGRAVGSGLYVDRLFAALRDESPGDEFDLLHADERGAFHKLYFEQWRFPRAARDYDVAHVPYWAPPLRPSVPTVVTVHDLAPLLLPAYRERASVRMYTALVARATAGAAVVLCDSHHAAAEVVEHLNWPRERVFVAHLGVDERFGATIVDRRAAAAVRTALALPERYGLYLGGFDERKNLRTLLAAWAGVYERTAVPLVIAGHLPTTAKVAVEDPRQLARRLVTTNGAVRFVGAVDERFKPALYANAAVFAFPSRYEGFGLPPLEAMAAGTPVVAADATSLPEVVGDAGLLVAPGDVDAWESALTQVLEDESVSLRLSEAGRRRAARFTWRATATATLAAYDAALAMSVGR